MRRPREFEDENIRLKRIVADLTLDRETLQRQAAQQSGILLVG
jgi:hypothetical protein